MLTFIEDVGRHNAIDTIAGWMATQGIRTQAKPQEDQPYAFYTTGRLTSEMVIKSAQMGIALVVSRSGITQMGYDVAAKLGLCTIGRAINKHFLIYTAGERLKSA
jgi:FdhD protein